MRVDATLLLTAPIDALLPAEIARAILGRIEPDVAYAELTDEHGTAAIGLGVVEGDWLGVFCMGTDPRARRCGYARAVLGSLAEWGRGRGARSAHLLVTATNKPARGLYGSLGFQP